MSDHYQVLGVQRSASDEEIKKAYRKLARELHPDVNDAPDAEERFKLVTFAYEVLSDSEQRRNYDMGGQSPFGANANFGFGDIFDSFFGGGGQRGPRSRAERGQDALIRVEMTLREVVFGVQRQLDIDTAVLCETCDGACCQPGTTLRTCDVCKGGGVVQRQVRSLLGNVLTTAPCGTCQGFGQTIPTPCVTCRGQGRVRARRSLDLNIPAGVEDGLRLQLAGQGEVGHAGGPNGDIYVDISVRADEIFTRQADDLHCTLEVPLHDAVLGALIKIETFDGQEQIEVRPGDQTGETVLVKGKGVKHLRSNGRGDLIVTLQVVTPSKLDGKQKELFRELQKLRKNDEPKLQKRKQGQYKAKR